MTDVPGVPIIHAVITPDCREVDRPHLDADPRMAAFEEAVNRARKRYRHHIEKCDPDYLATQNIRLAVTAEAERHREGDDPE